VILTILPPTGNPGPVVQPSGIVFVQAEGDTTPPQIVTITNLTNRSSDFSATSAVVGNLIWFNATPLVGTVLPNTPFQFSIALAPRVPAGVYRGSVTLNFPSDKATRVIDLELVVTPAVLSEPSFEGALSGRDAGAPCTPAKLLPVFTMLGTGFSTSVAWPTNLEVTVLDDCGTPMKNGGVSVSFSNGDLPISLLGTSDGKWSGTWTAINPRSSALTVTATATQVSTGLKGTVQVGGSAQANPDVPIVLGALSSGSYFKPPAPSPGELVSVFGLQLSDGLEQAQSLPLVTTLQNGTLLLGGRPLPLVFTSAGQINVQIPYDIPPGTIQQIIAQHGTKLSVPQPVSIRSSEPAIFSTDSSGAGQGHIYVITSSGQQLLANASNPATAGDVLVIYCTGLGNVSPAVTAGTAVPSDALRNTVGQTTLTIGGVNAAVAFAGLTPGLTGLYQVNVTVPAGVTAGNQVPVVLAVDGEPAPPVSMAVK
jgi:uncharacterized protein (TIGR03437 family)